ncbi:MAG: hypothetical protein Q8L48_25190, partial [Archangium sp.]|nr:hypothetical protein [Archangium sp.]
MACTYQFPGGVIVCGTEVSPGHYSCTEQDKTPHTVSWGCSPTLDAPCNNPASICTAAQWEGGGCSVAPEAGSGVCSKPTCTKAPHLDPRCKTQQHCNPQVACCPNVGDPIGVRDSRTTEQVTDLTLNSSLGALTFERYYSPSVFSFAYRDVFDDATPDGARFPFTFGASPSYQATAHWLDNWQTLVSVLTTSDGGLPYEVTALDPMGGVVAFPDCESLPCHLAASDVEYARRERLYLDDAGATLFTESGRYIYQHRQNGTHSPRRFHYRLSRWDDVQYASDTESPRSRAVVAYGSPSTCTGLDGGPAYVTSVTNAEGASIVFGWRTVGAECVLGSLDMSKGGTSERAVTFDYDAGPGLLSEVRYGSDGGGRVLTYGPSVESWTKWENGIQVSRHAFTVNPTDYGQGDVALFSRISSNDAGATSWKHEVPIMGSSSRTPLTLSFQLEDGLSPIARVGQVTQGCEGNECATSWTRNYTYSDGGGLLEGLLTTASNVRAGYSVYSRSTSSTSMPSGWHQPVELASVAEGASDSSGANALQMTEYAYTYGSQNQSPRGFEQFVSEESQPSLLESGQEAKTVTVRDSE